MKQNTLLTTALIALAVLVAGGFVGIVLPSRELDVALQRRDEAALTLASRREQNASEAAAQTLTDELAVTEARLNALCWSKAQQLTFLTTLEELASASGVEQDLTIGEIPTTAGVTALPVTIHATGSWPQVVTFIQALEQHQPLVLVDIVDSIATSTGLRVTLTGSTLWR